MSSYAFHPEAFTDRVNIREFIADPAERDPPPREEAAGVLKSERLDAAAPGPAHVRLAESGSSAISRGG